MIPKKYNPCEHDDLSILTGVAHARFVEARIVIRSRTLDVLHAVSLNNWLKEIILGYSRCKYMHSIQPTFTLK